MNRILIIEDDTDINNMICEALTKEGYSCAQAFSGTEGLLYRKTEAFSLIILDLMLPGMSGEEVLKETKRLGGPPVLVVSAKDSLDSKVELLTSGAEDYITKPFELKELLARVEVQLRRFSAGGEKECGEAELLKYGGLALDRASFCVTADGAEVSLTRQEFRILELLLSHPDKVFSKQEIYDYAWEEYYIGEDKTINVHISNIRRKLKAAGGKEYIETVWGIGFKLAKAEEA